MRGVGYAVGHGKQQAWDARQRAARRSKRPGPLGPINRAQALRRFRSLPARLPLVVILTLPAPRGPWDAARRGCAGSWSRRRGGRRGRGGWGYGAVEEISEACLSTSPGIPNYWAMPVTGTEKMLARGSRRGGQGAEVMFASTASRAWRCLLAVRCCPACWRSVGRTLHRGRFTGPGPEARGPWPFSGIHM